MKPRREFRKVHQAPAATPVKHPHYWKLKAAVIQHRLVEADARATVNASADALNAAIRDAGLDPSQQYDMVDATETIAPKV